MDVSWSMYGVAMLRVWEGKSRSVAFKRSVATPIRHSHVVMSRRMASSVWSARETFRPIVKQRKPCGTRTLSTSASTNGQSFGRTLQLKNVVTTSLDLLTSMPHDNAERRGRWRVDHRCCGVGSKGGSSPIWCRYRQEERLRTPATNNQNWVDRKSVA